MGTTRVFAAFFAAILRIFGSVLKLSPMFQVFAFCAGCGAQENCVDVTDVPNVCESAEAADADGDGYYNPMCEGVSGFESVQKWDCNDADGLVNPDAGEICDGRDNNCDDLVDNSEAYDDDGDGYLADITECRMVYSSSQLDCNDKDAEVHPGAYEKHDGIDNDCDGVQDEDFDADGDGYSVAMGDCDDDDYTVGPESTEVCNNDGTANGVDEDCDGIADDVCDASSTSYEAGYTAGYDNGYDVGLSECP